MTKVWSVRVWPKSVKCVREKSKQYKKEPCNWQECQWFDLYCSSMCMINYRLWHQCNKDVWAPLKLVILIVVCFSPGVSFYILYSIWTTCVSDTWNWVYGEREPAFQCVCCHVLWGLFCLPVFQWPYTWLVLLGDVTEDWRGLFKGLGSLRNAVNVLNDEKRGFRGWGGGLAKHQDWVKREFPLLRNKHTHTSTHAQSQLVKGARGICAVVCHGVSAVTTGAN